jgi:hypothetical protein
VSRVGYHQNTIQLLGLARPLGRRSVLQGRHLTCHQNEPGWAPTHAFADVPRHKIPSRQLKLQLQRTRLRSIRSKPGGSHPKARRRLAVALIAEWQSSKFSGWICGLLPSLTLWNLEIGASIFHYIVQNTSQNYLMLLSVSFVNIC